MFELDVRGLLKNDSGASRTYVWTVQFDGTTYLTYTEGAALTNSATSSVVDVKIVVAVYDQFDSHIQMTLNRSSPSTANTRQDMTTTASGQIWNNTANDFTDGGSLALYCHGQNTTATQTFTRKTQKAVKLT
jgi:hypothetical protein